MNKLRIAPLTAALFLLTWEASAACQGGPGGSICGGGAPSLSSPGGLQVSRGGSFRPLDSGALLRGGDRILSGANAATLALGAGCSATIAAGSLVTLSQSGGQTCARVSNVQGTPLAQQAAPGTPSAPGAPGAPGLAVGPGAPGLAGALGIPTAALPALGVAGVAAAIGVGVGVTASTSTVSAQ